MRKIWLTCDRWASLFFPTKILSEDPYLKSFISRVRSKHRERFCSFSRYCTRLHVEAFFLPPLHRGVGTKAVNRHFSLLQPLPKQSIVYCNNNNTCYYCVINVKYKSTGKLSKSIRNIKISQNPTTRTNLTILTRGSKKNYTYAESSHQELFKTVL